MGARADLEVITAEVLKVVEVLLPVYAIGELTQGGSCAGLSVIRIEDTSCLVVEPDTARDRPGGMRSRVTSFLSTSFLDRDAIASRR